MGKVLPLVLLLAPSLLAQAVDDPPQCASCCPPVEPVPDTVACDTLDTHLDMIEEAIEEAQCDDSSGGESDEVCHAITMKAIPPCMLMEGASEQAACLAEAAQDIEEELNTGEEAGTEVVAKCKCDAFKKIRKALSNVREMMCPLSDRTGRLLARYGGFIGGWYGGGYAHGGYARYRREVNDDNACPNGEERNAAGGCPDRKRRETPSPCPSGERNPDGSCKDRKRRETCPSEERNAAGLCPSRKRRETPSPFLPICLAGQDSEFDACQAPGSLTSDTIIPSCVGDEDPVGNLCMPKPWKCTLGGKCLFECGSRVLAEKLVCDGTIDCEGGEDEDCQRQGRFIFTFFASVAASLWANYLYD